MNLPDDPTVSPFAVVEPPSATASGGGFEMFGGDGFTFRDFIDIINPLQHIPIVSTIYRSLTDDTLDHAPRVAGGAVFGGPIGAVVGLLNVIVEEITGKDVGEHVMAMFDDAPAAGEQTVAAANTPVAGSVPPMPAWATQALMPPPIEVRVLPPPSGARVARAPLPRAQYADILGLPPATAPDPNPVPLARTDPKSAPPTNSTVLAALNQAENQADVFAATRFRATLAPEDARESAPPGATAAAGGWFSETMLDALDKYRKGSRLTTNDEPPSVSVEN